jgi:hypothetical protein
MTGLTRQAYNRWNEPGLGVAAFYRIYVLTFEGRVTAPPHVVECEDDDEAVSIARGRCINKPVEIWEKARRVARLAVQE